MEKQPIWNLNNYLIKFECLIYLSSSPFNFAKKIYALSQQLHNLYLCVSLLPIYILLVFYSLMSGCWNNFCPQNQIMIFITGRFIQIITEEKQRKKEQKKFNSKAYSQRGCCWMLKELEKKATYFIKWIIEIP